MLKIAICDDILEEREELKETCEKYFCQKGLICDYEMFQSGEEVLEYKGDEIWLLLLDIEMPGINGIKVMQQLLSRRYIWRIIFISYHSEYVMDSFSIKTLGFCQKPLQRERLYRYFDMAVYENNGVGIDKGKYVCIDERDIIYIKSDGHYTHVVTEKGEKLYAYSIGELEKRLEYSNIVRVHKSYMVNLNYIDTFKYSKIHIMNSEEHITVGRAYYKAFKERYEKYILHKPTSNLSMPLKLKG